MRKACALALALSLFAAGAMGQTPPPSAQTPDLPTPGEMPSGVPPDAPQPSIPNPDWLRRPSGEVLSRFYPRQAIELGMSGNATLFCSVRADGRLSDCRVIGEFPRNMDFGRAALQISSDFQMTPHPATPPGGEDPTVRIPVVFRFPGSIDPLTAFAVCYGLAARAAEDHPEDAAAKDAYMAWRMSYAYLLSQSYFSAETIEARLTAGRTTEGVELLRGAGDLDPIFAMGRMRRLCDRATPHPRPPRRPPASNAAPPARQ